MILLELKRLLRDAKTPPEVRPSQKKDPAFKDGYAHGFTDGVRECIEIVEEHEED